MKIKTEHTIWLAYVPGQGFITGGTKREYVDGRFRKIRSTDKDFTKARVFKHKHHATQCAHNGERVIPVPVKMSIDEEIISILELGGEIDDSH